MDFTGTSYDQSSLPNTGHHVSNRSDSNQNLETTINIDPLKGYNLQYKIIMLGMSSTGKTSLLVRFVDDVFVKEGQMNTIGIDLKSLTLQVDD